MCGRLVLDSLAESFGLAERVDLGLLPGDEVAREQESTGSLAALLSGEVEAVCIAPDGRMTPSRPNVHPSGSGALELLRPVTTATRHPTSGARRL